MDFATANGGATVGVLHDCDRTLTFAPGETTKTVGVKVLDDTHDDGEETLALTSSNALGARIEDAARR